MENNENKTNSGAPEVQTPEEKSCCTATLFTKDEHGNKKLSLLSWSILLVLLIGTIGIISSNRDNQKKLVTNTNEVAVQLQRESDVLQAQARLKAKAQAQAQAQAQAKSQKETKVSSANDEKAIVNKINELQNKHNRQMEQAQKAFDSLKSAYAQKLNEVVKDMQAQQEAKDQEVHNPELNFQLRGLSNVKVQFNNTKDISYIEIIQPENCKSYKNKDKDKSSCYPKKEKGWEDKGNKSWGNCKPMSKWDCEKSKCAPMPMEQKEYKNYNKWDCKPMKECKPINKKTEKWDCRPQADKKSDCGTY